MRCADHTIPWEFGDSVFFGRVSLGLCGWSEDPRKDPPELALEGHRDIHWWKRGKAIGNH